MSERSCAHVARAQLPEYLEFFRRSAVPWVPEFLHAPNDHWSSSGPPQDICPSSRTLGTLFPVSPPPSKSPDQVPGRPSPEGASAVLTCSGRLRLGCPLLPANSGTVRHCALAATSPGDHKPLRWHQGLHFRRRPSAAPRRRRSGPLSSLWHDLHAPTTSLWAAPFHTLPEAVLVPPGRPGEVTVGVARALLVPARAPLLAWLGVIAADDV